MAKKGEGTFSEVLKAQCIKNGRQVAIKARTPASGFALRRALTRTVFSA